MEAKATIADVGDAQNACDAASQTAMALEMLADQLGYDPDRVMVDTPADMNDGSHVDCWTIEWGALYEWPLALLGGGSAVSRELGRYEGTPEIAGLVDADNFETQCVTRYTMVFYDE